MLQKTPSHKDLNLNTAARAALDVIRADTPRQDELQTVLSWVNESTLCQTWAGLIRRSLAIHDDRLVACCQAAEAIIDDYYTRPPIAQECVSQTIKDTLGFIIGGALFATLSQPAKKH